MIITAKSPPRPHRRAARNTSVAALEFFIPQEDCGAHSERELLRELLRYGCGRVLTAREQELIRLHYAEGQSLTAIAARQGRSPRSAAACGAPVTSCTALRRRPAGLGSCAARPGSSGSE